MSFEVGVVAHFSAEHHLVGDFGPASAPHSHDYRVDVSVTGRKIGDVATDLAKIEGIGSVSIMLGDPPIIVQVQARDLEQLRDLILDEISAVVGVTQVETNVIVEIEKWKSQYGRFLPLDSRREEQES